LHVGDDAVLDVVGAQGVGMQTVWINRDEAPWGQHPPPDATVSSMSVLCDLLSDPGRGPAL
jgi:putative hydrolase of the HAD superfamily